MSRPYRTAYAGYGVTVALILTALLCPAAGAVPWWSLAPTGRIDPSTLEASLPSLSGGERARTLAHLAIVLRRDDPEEASARGRQALELKADFPDPALEGWLYLALSEAAFHLGEQQEQLKWAERARIAAEVLGDDALLWRAFVQVAEVEKNEGEYASSLQTLDAARVLAEQLGTPADLSRILSHRGNTYQRQGDFASAMDSLHQALEIQRNLDDPEGLARVLHDTARVYGSVEDFEQSLSYYQESLALTRRLEDRRGSAFNLRNIASILLELGRGEEALETARLALDEAEALGDRKLEATLLNNIAGLYLELEKFEEALGWMERAEPAIRVFGRARWNAVILINKGEALLGAGRPREALEALQTGLAAAHEGDARTLTYGAHELLSRTFEALDEPGRALVHFRRYKELYDTLHDEASQRRIDELQARFEAAEKDREIAALEHERELAAAELVRQRMLRNGALVGSLVALVLAGAITFSYRLKRKAHLSLRQAYGELETTQDLLRERAVEIAERQEMVAELETRNTELERFTYTVSHDLKSPLVTIKGFLGLLERDADAGNIERMRHDIGRIQSAAERMRHLLDDLLELSRVGRQSHPPERIATGELACEAVGLVAGQIAERGVEVDVAQGLPPIYGDRLRVLAVFQNLVENAVKYMGNQPSPRVEIGSRSENDGRDVFFVRDNGMGIEPEYQQKVFGLFERLDAGNDGTGVGLALVKRIVEVHGGRVWVESPGPGQGSTFCFTLPPESSEVALAAAS